MMPSWIRRRMILLIRDSRLQTRSERNDAILDQMKDDSPKSEIADYKPGQTEIMPSWIRRRMILRIRDSGLQSRSERNDAILDQMKDDSPKSETVDYKPGQTEMMPSWIRRRMVLLNQRQRITNQVRQK